MPFHLSRFGWRDTPRKRVPGVTPRAAASRPMVLRPGFLTPRSTPLTNVQCKRARSASCS
jgi:hypothetical protein